MATILHLFKNLQNKLEERSDSEHVQTYLRLLAGLAGITYSVLAYKYANQIGGWNLVTQIYIVIAGITVGGFGFLIHILYYPKICHIRRWLGAIHDSVWVGLAIYALGDLGMMFFGMYIWVVIGNGFRYGCRFLYGSAALALLSFYVVAFFSPHYRSNPGFLGLGTFLLAFVIPVYCGGLLKQLQQNLEAAREADELKTRFLSNVSHDLRTPLNAIMANCGLLAREPGDNVHQSRRLHDMQKAATTLNSLLVDLLDVARIEAGRIKIMSSSFNVIELLGRVKRFHDADAHSNNTRIYLTVAPNMPAHVFGDTLRLEQVLNNIISNAVKYTENGEVTIYAEPLTDQGTGIHKGIICSVRDTGIGIEPEAMGRIFSRFEQADLTYARRYSGAGLGLNIASELTTLMEGSIDVASTKGKGSCFTIKIPLGSDIPLESDTVPAFWKTSVFVICANLERKKYWRRLFNGTTRPCAPVITVQDLIRRIEVPAVNYATPCIVIVDAYMLDIDFGEIATLVSDFFVNLLSPKILVNAPSLCEVHAKPASVYKYYRCWINGESLDDVGKALTIANWTMGPDSSRADDDEEVRSWMSALQGLRVLVADDNELNRNVLTDMLAYTDAVVIEAVNGADALAMLSKQHIDIALLDIQMPELTGLEVMRTQLESNSELRVPVIALTADTTEECHAQCIKSGARSILHKPVDMKTLYRALYQVVTDIDTLFPAQEKRRMLKDEKTGLLDYKLLQELAEIGRQPDYIANLVTCFKQEGTQLLQGLRHTFKLNKLEDSRNLLHRLKGMCSSIGARDMASICQECLTLSDDELHASAHTITTILLRKHNDSVVLLYAFSESTDIGHLNYSPYTA